MSGDGMELRMIRYGMLAGFAFLMALALLEALAARRPAAGPRASLEGDVSNQVWLVLAEARKIVEESA